MVNHVEKIRRSLHFIATHKTNPGPVKDGVLTSRIIGEFSAGKTRFLRELFGDAIPKDLQPRSSPARETRLPLEITYGPQVALSLIKKSTDRTLNGKVRELERFTNFPDREATMAYDTATCRLRLEIPEERLILQNGDGCLEDKTAKRLFLVDMPGWNSGDDELAEGDPAEMMAGEHNLALVYVVKPVRMDGQENANRLSKFLEAFAKAKFVGRPHLIVILTNCSDEDGEIFRNEIRKRIMERWEGLTGTSLLSLEVLNIEFSKAPLERLEKFRQRFWKSLLAPLREIQPTEEPSHPWSKAIAAWPDSWQMDQPLAGCRVLLERARTIVAPTIDHGHHLAWITKTHLLGRDRSEMQKRLHKEWTTQMAAAWPGWKADAKPLHSATPCLAEGHPLTAWWQSYWTPQLQAALQPTAAYLQAMEVALNEVDPQIEDLQVYLHSRLDDARKTAQQALAASFPCLVDTIASLPKETAPDKKLATLLQLSLLQARYQDHLRFH